MQVSLLTSQRFQRGGALNGARRQCVSISSTSRQARDWTHRATSERRKLVRSSGSSSPGGSIFPLQLPEVIRGLRQNGAAVLVLEVLDMLAFLALIDAAYSGDWSRIGVLTKGQELLLQQVVPGIILAHAGCGVVCALSAAAMGKNPLVAAVKGFLFGAVGVYEYSVSAEGTGKQQ